MMSYGILYCYDRRYYVGYGVSANVDACTVAGTVAERGWCKIKHKKRKRCTHSINLMVYIVRAAVTISVALDNF